MKPPYSEEQLKAHFTYFEGIGETTVRAAINSGQWETQMLRLGAALEWIRQIDKSKSPPKKSWHETFIGKIIIGVIVGIILIFATVFITRHIISKPQQPQVPQSDLRQNK